MISLLSIRKREHLLNQIQSQALKIESLMQQLAEVTSASNKQKTPSINTTMIDLEKPLVLSPSTAGGPSFGSIRGTGPDENSDVTTNKDVSDWIAKARQSLDHFGSLVGIGGGATPQSYLMRGNYEESDSSDDDEFVDVSQEFDEFGNLDDHYEVAVEEPNSDDIGPEEPNRQRSLLHKSSASSLGTTGTANSQYRRKVDRSKPATLPVEASPFGLFGKLMLRNPSRANSTERDDEEDKGPGIANANFFKPSERFSCFPILQSLKILSAYA